MKEEIFWKNPGYIGFSSVEKNLDCEVLIIGGGISGLTLAYELGINQAKDVILLDTKTIGSGSTGASAGILVVATEELTLQDLIESIGVIKTAQFHHALQDAWHFVYDIINDHSIDCDPMVNPYYYLAKSYEDLASVHFNNSIREKFRFPSKLLYRKQIGKLLTDMNLFVGGETIHPALCVNPLKLSQNLANHLQDHGVRIYENSPAVISTKRNNVSSNGHEVDAKQVIDCRNYFPHHKQADKYITTIAVTEQLKSEDYDRLSNLTQIGIEEITNEGSYHYMRTTPDKRMLIGYGDTETTEHSHRPPLCKEHLASIHLFLQNLLGHHHPQIAYAWSGIYGASASLPSSPFDTSQKIISLPPRGTQIYSIAQARVLARLLAK